MFGVILAVITANACAVALGTAGVYESELEAEIRLNYLPQAGREVPARLPRSPGSLPPLRRSAQAWQFARHGSMHRPHWA